jgi:aryl-alcohol dehydrogenase-like predicted oxidoreductase
LGTLTFGREIDEGLSHELMDRFVEIGGNFIDTADIYNLGKAETIIGRWMKKRGNRDDIVLATKVYQTTGPGPDDSGLSRIHIQKAVEASLKRLQTDVIDLYTIHWWDPKTPIKETVEALNQLVRDGKVRFLGCSNLAAWQLSKYMYIADQIGCPRFISIQQLYNAINRSIENEVLPLCHEEGLGVIPYNILAGGMLTGKYEFGKPMPKGRRLEVFSIYKERYYAEEVLKIADQFKNKAEQMDVTPAQLALAWVLAEQRITSAILGVRNFEQFDDVVGGLDISLNRNERDEIPSAQFGRWFGKDPVYERENPPYMDLPGKWDPKEFDNIKKAVRRIEK